MLHLADQMPVQGELLLPRMTPFPVSPGEWTLESRCLQVEPLGLWSLHSHWRCSTAHQRWHSGDLPDQFLLIRQFAKRSQFFTLIIEHQIKSQQTKSGRIEHNTSYSSLDFRCKINFNVSQQDDLIKRTYQQLEESILCSHWWSSVQRTYRNRHQSQCRNISPWIPYLWCCGSPHQGEDGGVALFQQILHEGRSGGLCWIVYNNSQ